MPKPLFPISKLLFPASGLGALPRQPPSKAGAGDEFQEYVSRDARITFLISKQHFFSFWLGFALLRQPPSQAGVGDEFQELQLEMRGQFPIFQTTISLFWLWHMLPRQPPSQAGARDEFQEYVIRDARTTFAPF